MRTCMVESDHSDPHGLPSSTCPCATADWRSRLPIVPRGRYLPEDILLGGLTPPTSKRDKLVLCMLLAAADGIVLAVIFLGSNDEGARRREPAGWPAYIPVVVVTLAVIGCLAFILVRFKRQQRHKFDSGTGVFAERTMTFTDDTVVVEMPHAKTTFNWQAIEELGVTPLKLGLWMFERTQCVIVPKRLLQTEDDWEALLAMAAEKVRARPTGDDASQR